MRAVLVPALNMSLKAHVSSLLRVLTHFVILRLQTEKKNENIKTTQIIFISGNQKPSQTEPNRANPSPPLETHFCVLVYSGQFWPIRGQNLQNLSPCASSVTLRL